VQRFASTTRRATTKITRRKGRTGVPGTATRKLELDNRESCSGEREAVVSNIWHPTSACPQGRYDDIWFISPEIGWAVNSAGQIIHTTDGGKTPWSVQHTEPSDTYLRCISFSGPTDGWVGAITADRRLRKTQNGVEWTQIPEEILPKRPGLVCGICAVSKDVVYASGTQNPHEENTGVMRTTDGGRSWSELPVGNLANLLIDIYLPTKCMVGSWADGVD